MWVASPCHISWDSMTGDDRARFCGGCDRHVYNIVGLTRGEIESLVESTEGRLCVRMYQRPDATVLTEDCPVGLRLIRKRVATFAGAALSALLGLVSVGYGQDSRDQSQPDVSVERVKIDSGWSEISGLVTDPTGAVVPGAEVLLKGIGFEKYAKTDAGGRFRFESLRPDLRYEITFERDGFKKLVITKLDLASGDVLTVKVRMEGYKSSPYAPVEQNLSPVLNEPASVSSSVSTQPIDSCVYSETQVRERVKIDSKRGQISGQIFDRNGAIVAGIKLKLQLEKRVVAGVTSDASGAFVFPEIKPAENYILRIDAQQGWKKQAVERVTVNAGEKISYSVCIQVDDVYEVVGLFGEPIEILLTDATRPTESFVPRQTYPLPSIPKETRSKPRPKQ